MASKRQKRLAKKRNNQREQPQRAATEGLRVITNDRPTNRPTPERYARGNWAEPRGQDKRTAPTVDLQPDMIGRLHQDGKLTISQEQAARTWQELHTAYVAELEVPGYKSCIAGSTSGHDESDGNPEVVQAYYALRDRIGRPKSALLASECYKQPHERCKDLPSLRNALDCVARA